LASNNLAARVRRKAAIQRRLRRASRDARRQRSLFDDVERYCAFIGFGRSGTTLTGQLLNAHPEVVVAYELDAVRWLRNGANRDQLFSLIIDRDRDYCEHGMSAGDAGYRYAIEGQWQGRFSQLRVIGDKEAAVTTSAFGTRPQFLDLLRTTVGVPIRCVCVIRNSFDTAMTMAFRNQGGDLVKGVAAFVERAEQLARTRELLAPDELIDIRYESLLDDPKHELERLCAFIGVEPSPEYLDACAAIVYPSPKRTRDDLEWPPELKAAVEHAIATHSFISGYTFDE